MLTIIPITITFLGLLLGTYTDLRTREVPDWVNYGLMIIGFGWHALASILQNSGAPLIESIVGFGIFFALAWFMFHTGQWGGGDSKMLMALGALLGLPLAWPLHKTITLWIQQPPLLIITFVAILFCGAVYGLGWLIYFGLKEREKVFHELRHTLSEESIVKAKIILLSIVGASFVSIFFIHTIMVKTYLIGITLLTIISFYLWITSKVVEKVCMVKNTAPQQLTEGDWVVQDITIKGRYICGPKDLGLSKEQIKILLSLEQHGEIKTIPIKYGIPFVPSFLMAFIVAVVMQLHFYVNDVNVM